MEKKEKNYALQEGWISIVGNTLLFVLKFWAGIVSGSVAIIADAWHTLSDSFSSILVIIGAKVSNKPADKQHPFGHGRAEIIASIIIGVLLAVIAFDFVLESIHKLRNHESAQYGKIAIFVTIFSVLVKEALAQYAFWASRRSKAKSLKADAWHHRSDAISSLVLLIGILVGKNYWWMDAVLGFMISALLFYAVYEIMKDSISSLLGEKAPDELVQQIMEVSQNSTDIDVRPHHILAHNYGNHTEVTLHIKLPPDMNLEEAHSIATKIEQNIEKDLKICATIHMEPGK
jgi:cation diffusion facilitator family transporter